MRDDGKRRYKHEDYSAAIIRDKMKDVIESHQLNHRNYHLKADDIADLLEAKPSAGGALLWGGLIAGQMDADRIDYLIRDSLHTGVDYGKFDWRRLINTVELIDGDDEHGQSLGVNEGGHHAAEGLVLARYFMFTQVYFHKTRVAFNVHLKDALSTMLPTTFPRPVGIELDDYLRWDDWRVLGMIAAGEGGEPGRRLAQRDHYREVYHTPDSPSPKDIKMSNRVREKLGDLIREEVTAGTSTYKFGDTDIPVVSSNLDRSIRPLSKVSMLVRGLRPVGKISLFCAKEDVDRANQRLQALKPKRRTQ
jgi:HD superfamily phosphohydrolase